MNRKPLPRGSLGHSFWSRVDKNSSEEGCWLWLGPINIDSGYGTGYVGVGYSRFAHVLAFEDAGGVRFDQVDHTCHSFSGCNLGRECLHRRCVNPDHLEAVSRLENMRRSEPARRTHCHNGHEHTDENTYRDSKGFRHCRTCSAANQARQREKRRSA